MEIDSSLFSKEFIDSRVKYAEVEIGGYTNVGLARTLGRALHGKKGLDPKGEIEVTSDPIKKKVYLLRK